MCTWYLIFVWKGYDDLVKLTYGTAFCFDDLIQLSHMGLGGVHDQQYITLLSLSDHFLWVSYVGDIKSSLFGFVRSV